MPAQFTRADSWRFVLTSLSSLPASPTGPPCRLTAPSQSSTRTDCWSLSPGDIPQSTEPLLCLHRRLCSGVRWSEEEEQGRVVVFSGRNGALCWEHHAQKVSGDAAEERRLSHLPVQLLVHQQVGLGPASEEPHDVFPHLRAQQLRQAGSGCPRLNLRGPQHRRQQPVVDKCRRESAGGETRKKKAASGDEKKTVQREAKSQLVFVILFVTQSGCGSERLDSPTRCKDGETKGLKQIRGSIRTWWQRRGFILSAENKAALTFTMLGSLDGCQET